MLSLIMNLRFDFLLVASLFIYNYLGGPFTTLSLIGLIISLPCYLLWIIARIQLGKYFSTLPKAKGLVVKGLYSKLRNPVYIFSTLSIFGAILPSNNIFQYLFLAIVICVQFIRSHKEEKVLKKRFGKKYLQYKKQTWF